MSPIARLQRSLKVGMGRRDTRGRIAARHCGRAASGNNPDRSSLLFSGRRPGGDRENPQGPVEGDEGRAGNGRDRSLDMFQGETAHQRSGCPSFRADISPSPFDVPLTRTIYSAMYSSDRPTASRWCAQVRRGRSAEPSFELKGLAPLRSFGPILHLRGRVAPAETLPGDSFERKAMRPATYRLHSLRRGPCGPEPQPPRTMGSVGVRPLEHVRWPAAA
jgi:hypothetical protein